MTRPDVDLLGEEFSTSFTLLKGLQIQDPKSWQRFVDLYRPVVDSWCKRAGLQAADILDVSQDVFRAVFTAIGKYQYERPGDTFRGWLYTITRNKILDRFRRQGLQDQAMGGTDHQSKLLQVAERELPESSQDLLKDDRSILLRTTTEMILAECNERTRQAFYRVVIGNEDPAEVAKSLGMTVNAIRLLKSRLLAQIRQEFALVTGSFEQAKQSWEL